MKRLVVVLSGLLILPAFAEVAPYYYDAEIEMTDTDAIDAEFADSADVDTQNNANVASVPATSNARANTSRSAGRTTSSRAVSSGRTNITNGNNTTTRAVSARASNTGGATAARTTVSRAATTRAGTTAASRAAATSGNATRNVVASRNMPTATNNTTARAATTGAANVARASIVQTDTVNTPLYTGRVGTTSTVRARVPTVRMASTATTTTTTSTAETKADTAAEMDELAQMTDYCKAQYTQCMDNFCNVLDDNQGRCSCSANLKNYSKTETALKQATENLQDVAQQIQYIGLTKDEIETLFTQTEAELKMQNTTDNSQMKNDLDRIKNMIVDVKSGTASVTDTGMSFDLSGLLDFSISSTGFDLSSLFGNTTSTSSISNQRGEQLYKTATARCKAAVLNSCANQGVDVSVITNSYDLEIDKQCIAYERSLSDANDQMSSTVRNAKSVLQKARLMVAQQKNAYDLRGCVNALDSCMQDEFVCGTDYENCLDPTGKYIVNGEVVVGGEPGVSGGGLEANSDGTKIDGGLYEVWNYTYTDAENNKKNASAFGNGSVAQYVANTVNTEATNTAFRTLTITMTDKKTPTNMAKYLQQKIGYSDKDGKNYGMCISVLNKCQDYTYTSKNGNTKTYNPDNDVVRNYLERVSMQIKAAQDEVLADYAESCISDVSACLSQNNYTSIANTNTTIGNVSAVSVAACRPVINTCMSATGYGTKITSKVYAWLQTTLGATVTGTYGSLSEVKNEAACAAIHGTWSAGNCSCKSTTTFTYGMCECSDSTKTWDDTSSSCK
ncbi:MAG: hypothetical protein NC311_00315 [Muribaculaceae bacterium]|nr:hypothetical protein [Muribaculaceae bacterium]